MDIVNNHGVQRMKEALRMKFASLSNSGEFVKRYLDVRVVIKWMYGFIERG
jgi:hypothetical protein